MTRYPTFVPFAAAPKNGVAATVTLSLPLRPTAGETMTLGSRVYTWVTQGSANADLKINRGADAVAQIETFTTRADVGADLDGKFFQLSDDAGTVGFWFDVDDSGTTIPAGAAALDRAVEITTIATADSANDVATKVATAVNADSKYSASANTNVVTVTHATAGDVADGAAGTSAFTAFTVTTNGANAISAKTNVIAAINGTDGINIPHPLVSIGAFAGDDAVVTARNKGLSGNAIVSTETMAGAGNQFSAATLTGGVNGTPAKSGDMGYFNNKLYLYAGGDDQTAQAGKWYSATAVLVT